MVFKSFFNNANKFLRNIQRNYGHKHILTNINKAKNYLEVRKAGTMVRYNVGESPFILDCFLRYSFPPLMLCDSEQLFVDQQTNLTSLEIVRLVHGSFKFDHHINFCTCWTKNCFPYFSVIVFLLFCYNFSFSFFFKIEYLSFTFTHHQISYM